MSDKTVVALVPDHERWLHQPDATADLEAALEWARDHAPADDDVEALLERLNGTA